MLLLYLKSCKWPISLWALLTILFEGVLFLYGLPGGALLYIAVLALVLGGIFFLIGFGRFQKRHHCLEKLRKAGIFEPESLPEAADRIEKDYQDILTVLLKEKEKLLEEMNGRYQNMTDYYTTWVHQIKTPIAAMRLILQSGGSAGEQEQEELSVRLQEIEQYVEMVLGFLRLESDTTDYVIREYELDGILKQAVKKYAAQFIRKKIKLQMEQVHFRVLTDEKWLSFVLEQVLANALKYTGSGSIRIWMPRDGVLCIQDTGIGIAAEDLPRIFEKGFTGYNGRRDKGASGIGLYLCRRICGSLGHTITAESKAGEGTSVFIGFASEKLDVED